MQKTRMDAYVIDGTPLDIRERYASLADYAAKADFGILDRNVVVLDTETTGFSFKSDELTQIAAARMECGVITEWFVTFVNPGHPIPEDVARLTDIHDEDVADAPSPAEALTRLVEFVGDSAVVAHNAEFDRTFTATRHPEGAPLAENLWIDSLDLARIALPRLRSHRLIDLVRAFDAPISTHRADADVEALCAVYRILLSAIANMPVDLVRCIAGLTDAAQWPTGEVFSRIADLQEALIEAEDPEGPSLEERRYPFNLRATRAARLRKVAERGVERSASASAGIIESEGMHASGVSPANSRPAADRRVSKVLEFPTPDEIEDAFTAQGLVGSLYEGFEPRAEQVAMAEEVLRAFSTSTNLVVEAGTGVGKSMAYLVPAALIAARNNVPVGVATKTNALLDQIVYKELPLIDGAMRSSTGRGLTYVPLKGFSHYPCLYRINRLMQDGAKSPLIAGKPVSQAPSIGALLSFVEQTEYDDIDDLKLDYRAVPRYAITTTSRDCMRRKCPFYGMYCYVHGLRKRAESADVVVTNHSLLFCDIAADGGLLPPIRLWTVDEAHGAESEARRALAVHLEAIDMVRLANKLSSQDAKRNVFIRCERQSSFDGQAQTEAASLFYSMTEKSQEAGAVFAEAATEFAHHMKDLMACDKETGNRHYETIELWINDDVRASDEFQALRGFAAQFCEAGERLVRNASELVAFLEDEKGMEDCQREAATVVIEVKEMLQSVELILEKADPRFVYSAKLSRKPDRVAEELTAAPVDVGEVLDQTLYENTDSVVFASATITVGEDFGTFHNALGLNRGEASRANDRMLGSSYDFDSNMRVLVIDDIPEPSHKDYLPALQQLLVDMHLAQHGSMLTLFTNRREMEACFDAVHPQLKAADLRLVCQKWGVSTKGLRDDFLTDEHLSLFALKSFWEGFDAPGATLKGVVIPKLPFAKPSDPLSCERAVRDERAWAHYTLPQAVIEVKQAAGRLIRSSTDTGVLVLADRRLLTKGYGKMFLKSLPSKNVTVCSSERAVQLVAEAAASSFGCAAGQTQG